MAGNRATNRIFLGSAVLLGVVAMAAAFIYLDNAGGEGTGPKAKILVAKRDLRENAVIDPEKDLTEMDIPASFVMLKDRALDFDKKKSYKGERLNRDVPAGVPVLKNDLAATQQIELRAGTHAISVQVRGANALGGIIYPGNYVKLMVTRPLSAPPRSVMPSTAPATVDDDPNAGWTAQQRFETVPITAQPLKVLAINQRTTRARPLVTAADQYQAASEATGNHTVMLEVSEAQAKSILEQTGAGQLTISLLLCPPPDGAQ